MIVLLSILDVSLELREVMNLPNLIKEVILILLSKTKLKNINKF